MLTTTLIVVAALAAFLLAMLSTELVRRHAHQLGLLSIPNQRSSHTQVTPHGGGLGIVIAFVIVGGLLLWWLTVGNTALIAAICLACVIAMIGLLDDVVTVSRKLRLIIQLLCCGLFLALSDAVSFSASSIAAIGYFGFVLLVFAAIWWINLFNFMDGTDGLAASQAVFMLSAGFILLGWGNVPLVGEHLFLLMLLLLAAVCGFLVFNWPKASIFMGDVGSTFLAFLLFCFAVLTADGQIAIYAMWLIVAATFVSDATITLLRRLFSGQAWLDAHRSHLYQQLSRRWNSHKQVLLLYVAVNLCWLFPLAWASLALPDFSWWLVLLAYMPLLILAWALGAGRPEN